MSGFLDMLPAVDGSVACGGAEHRVRWTDGEVLLLDHDDPEGERILAALGGEASACVATLEAWHRCCADVSLLWAFNRGLADRVRASMAGVEGRPGAQIVAGLSASLSSTIHQGQLPRRSTGGFYGIAPSAVGNRDVREDLLLLMAAGGGLVDRLAAQTIGTWSLRAEADAAPVGLPALRAALCSRVWMAMAGWVAAESSSVTVEVTGPQAASYVRREGEGWRVALPLGWLARVWAPGLAVTAGRFVLDAVRDGEVLRLSTVGADGSVRELTVA
ncbi:MAG: hypothetical protein ACT4QF_21795 [Sporichthyaceae bacterium]|jgi:hypothetical protein